MPAKILEGVLTHAPAGDGAAKNGPDEFKTKVFCGIHKRRFNGIGPPKARWDVVTVGDALLGEFVQRGWNIRKGIRLMGKCPGDNPHHAPLFDFAPAATKSHALSSCAICYKSQG
jgi:hypothetical protein